MEWTVVPCTEMKNTLVKQPRKKDQGLLFEFTQCEPSMRNLRRDGKNETEALGVLSPQQDGTYLAGLLLLLLNKSAVGLRNVLKISVPCNNHEVKEVGILEYILFALYVLD